MAAKKKQTKPTEEINLDEEDLRIVAILGHLIRSERLPKLLQPYFRQPFMLFALRLKQEMRSKAVDLDQADEFARRWVQKEREKRA